MFSIRAMIVGALAIAVLISFSIHTVGVKVDALLSGSFRTPPTESSSTDPSVPAYTGVLLSDRTIARIAWQYFRNNTQASTGLVNAVKGYPSATLWDTASYLIALICAERLELIGHKEFHSRASKTLHSLTTVKLYNNQMPNKVYHTKSLAMVNYANLPTPGGIGWSAIDVSRLMVPLKVFVTSYPKLAVQTQRLFERFDVRALIIMV